MDVVMKVKAASHSPGEAEMVRVGFLFIFTSETDPETWHIILKCQTCDVLVAPWQPI